MSISPSSPPLRVGDFVADPGLDTLTGPGGEAVHLEPKIMEVLLVLARRRNETVSQEEILAEVWEGKFVVEAVVTRAVSELRKALGDDSKAPRYIQTIARRGYRLIADVAPFEAASEQGAKLVDATSVESAESTSPPPAEAISPSREGREADVSTAPAPGQGPARASSSAAESPSAGRSAYLLTLLFLVVAAAALLRWYERSSIVGVGPDAPAAAVPAEAFRLYARARAALAGGSCVAREARADLERALELAPQYADAWEQLGWAEYNLVSSCGESGSGYPRAIRAAERALELRPASTQALALEVAVLAETGRAEEAFRRAERHAGESSQTDFLAAYAATYGGALEVAVERIGRVEARDRAFFSREGWTPNALLYLGDYARFLDLVPEAPTPLLRFYRGYADWRLGRIEEAKRELAPAFRERPADPFARLAEALVAIVEGREAEARLLLAQLALQRDRLGASDGELTFRIAELLAAAGDDAAAEREAERSVRQGFFCSRCLERSNLSGLVGRGGAFADALERERRFRLEVEGVSRTDE